MGGGEGVAAIVTGVGDTPTDGKVIEVAKSMTNALWVLMTMCYLWRMLGWSEAADVDIGARTSDWEWGMRGGRDGLLLPGGRGRRRGVLAAAVVVLEVGAR